MSIHVIRSMLLVAMMTAGGARTEGAQTCLAVDEAHDTLGRDERVAALLLLGKQFELAGHQVVKTGCATTYTISHIRLGNTIVVTLSGPSGSRQATAVGLDDLPAVYSQMVRSLLTGQPMGSLAVVDRTNVTASQDTAARRVQSEGTWYAKVGAGTVFTESTDTGGSFGFGYRAEFDRLGLDFSFLNMQLSDTGGYYGGGSSVWSLIKLQGLYFTNPIGNRSLYFGGGLGYGRTELTVRSADGYPGYGHGAGLQAGLTAGYEIARVTSARVFVQTDVTLPFYHVVSETYSYSQTPVNGRYVPPIVTTSRQYAPSIAFSVGFGWQRRPR